MEGKKVVMCSLLLLLLTFAPEEAVSGEDARLCWIPSAKYENPCLSNKNCDNICRCIEKYDHGGECQAFHCVCKKTCP